METVHVAAFEGIGPELLISQVRNTAPFIFEPDFRFDVKSSPFLARLREGASVRSFADYYLLNLAAHYGTCATFVPTDVDNHIRQKLWQQALKLPGNEKIATLSAMVNIVIDAASWDVSPVSARWVKSPVTGEVLSGHKGEWFSVAAAAYGATRALMPEVAEDLATRILREVQREEQIFSEIIRARDGVAVLTAATIIAHNLGDLDRVLDIWSLPVTEGLREAVYKRGHSETQAPLARAGRVNKELMAHENHRHFALREPRPMRRYQDLLLPTAPFLDHWGAAVARHPGLSAEEKADVAAALIEGWDRLNTALWKKEPQHPGIQGYARALAGLEGAFPGGPAALQRLLPAKIARHLKAGRLRTQVSVPRSAFEGGLAKRALNAVN